MAPSPTLAPPLKLLSRQFWLVFDCIPVTTLEFLLAYETVQRYSDEESGDGYNDNYPGDGDSIGGGVGVSLVLRWLLVGVDHFEGCA